MAEEEDGAPLRGFYRRLAEMYLKMAGRSVSPQVHLLNLQQASDWQERALGADRRAAMAQRQANGGGRKSGKV